MIILGFLGFFFYTLGLFRFIHELNFKRDVLTLVCSAEICYNFMLLTRTQKMSVSDVLLLLFIMCRGPL